MNALISSLATFTVTILSIVALRPLAVTLDLIDRPGGRKTHHGEVPIIGGMAMFIGVVVGLGLLLQSSTTPVSVLTGAFGLLVMVGLLDDRFNLSPWIRLPIHLAVALLLVAAAGCRVYTLGDAFGLGVVDFNGIWVTIASVVLIAAAINAFNMLDGLDGLAGTTAAVAVAALGYVAWRNGDLEAFGVCAVLLGAICGFLLFNVPFPGERPLRCFMGDAGSTLLGVAIAWVMARLSQPNSGGAAAISPVTALWIGGLPLFELIWSFMRRVGRGRSPFVADAEHFHHLLMRAGFSVRGAFGMLLILTLVLAACGLLLDMYGVAEYWSLLALLVAGIFVVRSMYRIGWLLRLMPKLARRQISA